MPRFDYCCVQLLQEIKNIYKREGDFVIVNIQNNSTFPLLLYQTSPSSKEYMEEIRQVGYFWDYLRKLDRDKLTNVYRIGRIPES